MDIDQFRNRLLFTSQEEPENQFSTCSNSRVQWWLYNSQRQLRIENDHVIEAHYCQPGAKGMTLFTANYGNIFIDFDTMKVQGSQLGVQRKVIPLLNEAEAVGWYFYDNKRWYEYGTQATCNHRSSVNSVDVEQEYKRCPHGTFHFSVGMTSYSLDFKEMTQRNLTTQMKRQIRRRPKFRCIIKTNPSLIASTQQAQAFQNRSPTGKDWKWQFMGDEGQWTDYSYLRCSISSATIENTYQQNTQDSIKFTAGMHTYTLHFRGMCQVNDRLGTLRAVRRIQNFSNSFSPQFLWQFKDVGDVWINFSKGSCSVSSEDIETEYQKNSSGTMSFSTERFHYEINFSAMTQKNLITNTTRMIRRIQS